MTWQKKVELKVEIALRAGAIPSANTAYPWEFETETPGVSSAALGEATFEEGWGSEGWFTVDADPAGRFETGGRFADETIPDDSWVDVTCDVLQVATSRWKPSRLASMETGTCRVVLDDAARAYDPLNTSGPYMLNPSYTLCRRGRRVRVRVLWAGVWWPIWAGFVDAWPASLETFPYAERTLDCVDWFGLIAAYDGPDIGSLVGGGETVDARIHRILDLVDVPATDRDIGPSPVTLQSTNLSGNALSVLKVAAACDGGDVWVSPDGRVTFRSRVTKWQRDETNRTQWTLTNKAGVLLPGEGRYEGVPVVTTDLRDTVSQVSLARAGGTAQTVIDEALAAELGNNTHTRTDLISQTDAQVLELAQWILGVQPSGSYRFDQLELAPDVWPENWWPAIAGQLFDRLTVVHVDPVVSATRSRDGLIIGTKHNITPQSWRTTLGLEDVTGLHAFTFGESAFEGPDVFI